VAVPLLWAEFFKNGTFSFFIAKSLHWSSVQAWSIRGKGGPGFLSIKALG